MKVFASPDRVAKLSLGLLAAGHAILFALFLASLLLLAPQAHAAAAACKGSDLLAELGRDDPAKLAAVRAEAAKVVNGDGILWRIEKAGLEPSFLLGTMHISDDRVTELSEAARQAFGGSDTLVIETTDVLDDKKMAAAMLADPDLTSFTDGTTLESHLSAADAAVLKAGLDERGIPLGTVARMKPWVISTMLSVPACELARRAGGAQVLDIKLARDAEAANKQVLGLETAASQMRAFASLPLDYQMKSLVSSARMQDRLDDVTETMVAIYESGETGLFWPLFGMMMPDDVQAMQAAGFEEIMVKSRNRGMADAAVPILKQGKAFVAVGALHPAGPDGLDALLQRKGFTLTPVE